jgi:hypothetical protein
MRMTPLRLFKTKAIFGKPFHELMLNGYAKQFIDNTPDKRGCAHNGMKIY